MKFLKYILSVVILTVVGCSFQSCRKHSPNGQLDGQWQIQTVEYKTTGDVSSPYPKHYICLNLHVVNLTYTDGKVMISGNMHYDKDAATVAFDFPSSEFNKNNADPESFGFMAPQVTFKVVALDSKKLVMESPETVVTCRRY